MATIKSYTDIEQSKKLAEILSLESADMYWDYDYSIYSCNTWKYEYHPMVMDDKFDDACIPAWSLATLLDFLKDKIIFGGNSPEGWFCCYTIKNPTKTLTIYGDSLVDACYELILKLHEQNLL